MSVKPSMSGYIGLFLRIQGNTSDRKSQGPKYNHNETVSLHSLRKIDILTLFKLVWNRDLGCHCQIK